MEAKISAKDANLGVKAKVSAKGAKISASAWPNRSGGPSGSGTNDHTKLVNREAPGQHPISAITGLSDRILPDITDADNGKFPRIVDGQWVKEYGNPASNLHVVDVDDITSISGLDFSSFSAGDVIFIVGSLPE